MARQPTARAHFAHEDRTSVLRLEGAVRYAVARPLAAFLDSTVAIEPTETMVCDLRDVTFLDSTALGLVARAGRLTLSRSGRRAVLVCPDNDVARVLRSAALDVLFVFVTEPPVALPAALTEVPIGATTCDDGAASGPSGDASFGRTILEAHRDLSALSERNREEYRDVITALETELAARAACHADGEE